MIETEEIWVPVIAYEGSYECSSLGRVRSIDRYVRCKTYKRPSKGKILKFHTNPSGYHSVGLSRNMKIKWFLVNRLIYQSFKGRTNLHIDHINDIKTDNRIINLQPLSVRENNSKSKARGHKTSRFTGVSKYNAKWKAQIVAHGKKCHLGYFDTEEQASQAYQSKLITL